MQNSETCVLCRQKIENLQSSDVYTSEGLAHLACIEDKPCCLCGISGFCISCQHRDCTRTFHSACSKRFLSQGQLCDLHQKNKNKKKELQRVWTARQVANRVGQSPELVKRIKNSDNKQNSICTGQVFWYNINFQYFPSYPVAIPELDFNYLPEASHSSWPEDVDSELALISSEISEILKSRNEILSTLPTNPALCPADLDLKEEDQVLCETRNLALKENFEVYLRYSESRVKEETESNSNTEKKTSSLREVPKNEEDFICYICGDGDYEDDDLIVICSICEMGVHMKCYGIPVVPEDDWVCHGCKATSTKEERDNLKCALCPVRGGCIKPTTHTTTNEVSFPNYEPGLNERVWCHVFCAVHLDLEVFKDKEFLDDINLTVIDQKRFQLKCLVCKSRDGACLQCQFGRCQVAFHPECAKELFTSTRDKTGYDEVSYFCPLHKPLKLRRTLENREKKYVDDILNFAKQFDRTERRAKFCAALPIKRTSGEKPFSYDEKCKLIKLLESEVEKLCESTCKQFSVLVKMKSGSMRNKVEVYRPESYNLLDPETITHRKLTIKGRKPAECQKYYSENIYPIMKKELEIMKKTIVQFSPKLKKKTNLIKKKLKNRPLKMEIPKNDVVYVQQKIDSVLVEDIVTKEVYCICRRPFVERSVKRIWESESDFLKRTEDSKMIQCETCDEWYHYKCIGIDSKNLPECYYCEKCTSTGESQVALIASSVVTENF